ncbi:hypothetical protein BT93_L1962 [Corymbia citriodora subsp. variegata]|uniref:Uncharacterized protein n=1 Tax=Corymbia citriodora subsp. variegata TaxID=360336 RepID=A0A8T0CLD0_CORYI|nr:hypothetical protein BT93_L1962 [Corymbia citriodora subsp. variegata]
MASFSAKNNAKYSVRSISLPSRIHPTTAKVDGDLNKLKSWEASSTSSSRSLRAGISGLEELYISVDELLNMASTRQVLSCNQDKRFTDELLDGSVQLIDMCGSAREILLHIKENVGALQSAIRRRKGDSNMKDKIVGYSNLRKKTKKDVKRLVSSLKKMEANFGASSLSVQNPVDQHWLAIMRVLREANLSSILIFQSLMSLLAPSVSMPKQIRWPVIMKLMHKGTIACNGNQEDKNEFECVDVALSDLSKCLSRGVGTERMKITNKQLENLEASIGSLEDDMECLFRHLIKTRASLLNIIS